ncbi:MAG: heavy metal translocating P-type ATPase metal-binding domain-containing protein [Vicinamibacterales bacterium]
MTVTAASSLDTAWPVDATGCRHCGDPCRDGAVRGDRGTFCCPGCESVFTLLDQHGMTAFYACDVRPGVSQRGAGRDPDRFAVLDEPDVTARLVRTRGADRALVTFPVPALHCASCLWLLERLWRFDAGILRSEANLVTRTVRIEFRAQVTSLRAIAERLAALGYEPVVEAEADAAPAPVTRRRLYLRLGVAGFAFGNVMLFSIPRYANGAPLDPGFQRLFDGLNLAFALPVLLYSASDWFRAAWAATRARAVTLDVPVALGLVVLFGRSVFDIVTGTGEGFLDSFTGLVFFLLIGRLFQEKAFEGIAFDRTVRSFFPLSVRVERGGALVPTRVEALRPGDVLVLRPREVVPADAVLAEGTGAVDYAFVTGEQAPVSVAAGAMVQAGGRVVGHALKLVVSRPVSQSRLAALWTDPVFAEPRTPALTPLLARVGWWFTVGAIGLAAAGAVAWWPDAGMSVQVATAVLIVACPCALTLAAPLTLGTAMGVLGRAGVYLKQPAVALDLARVRVVTFDKTGTLTTPAAGADVSRGGLDAEAWTRVAGLAAESVHPVSRALADATPADRRSRVTDVEEVAGEGLTGLVDGHRVVLGTAAFVAARTGHPVAADPGRTWAAVGEARPGWFTVTVRERAGMRAAVARLGRRFETWLLSGDHATDTGRWRELFGERVRFRQSPSDKLAAIRARQATGAPVLMVGDGLNDAGALAAADVGVAVSDETACVVPACDAIVRGDQLAALPDVLAYARRARVVLGLCFAVSVAYNVFGLTFALAGRLTPLGTAVLMPASSLTVIALAVGLMRARPPRGPSA